MKSINRTIKLLVLICITVLLAGSSCAETKRSRIIQKTKTDSCDLSEMGKNKYFHSTHYKRAITHSTRKIHRRK
jgi:hypothetical protein